MRSTGKGAYMEASMVIGHLRFLFPVFNLSTDLYATHETQKGMEENINILFRSFAEVTSKFREIRFQEQKVPGQK